MAKATLREFLQILERKIETHPGSLVFLAFSAPFDQAGEIKRLRLRPLLIKGELFYQIASFTKTQCFTVNTPPSQLSSELVSAISRYTQLICRFASEEIHAHFSETSVSYKVTEHKKVFIQDLSHNRSKCYTLQENMPSETLKALGIQTQDGRVAKDKYDKFKQINRFLELVQDLLPELGQDLSIVDFGCGKAYLTFALFEVLKEARIVGIDARQDLIQKCSDLAETLGLANISFQRMRIDAYHTTEPVDLVLALHACDVATDAAINKAVELKAKALLIAPCCQHEIATQIKKEAFPLLLKHGLLKERFSALLTDTLRAEYLEQMGYSVDLCEFIDPEHTPKNLLIRAIRKKNPQAPDWTSYKALATQFGISLSLLSLD